MVKKYLITTERKRIDVYHLTFTVDAENIEEAKKKADEDYNLPDNEEWIDTEYVNKILEVKEKEAKND